MAVVMKAKSGKSILFYDDDGNAFVTSVKYMQGLIDGKSPRNFMLLKKLDFGTDPDRFKNSPTVDKNGDVLGYAANKERAEKKPIEDVKF